MTSSMYLTNQVEIASPIVINMLKILLIPKFETSNSFKPPKFPLTFIVRCLRPSPDHVLKIKINYYA